MKLYYTLLFRRINRHLKELGIEPIIAYVAIPCFMYWGSSSFFEKVMYANYLYPSLVVFFVATISFSKHDDFLKQQFSNLIYRGINVLNNVFLVLPFLFFLVYKQLYAESILVLLLVVILSFLKKLGKVNFVLPTPFYRWPHEFIVGFRKTFWVFLLSYGVSVISILVDNFNLGVFGIVSIFFICSLYYSNLEPQFYIWVHAMTPEEFLKNKITIAIRYSILLTIPIVSILAIFYFDQIYIALMFEVLGVLYVVMYILMKYAFNSLGNAMFQGIIGVLCLFFPPAMFLLIPYFYYKAKSNLTTLLK
ncbi:hypothetical protein D1816_23335 [Aquimarina sp. AD10]|uniref:hypothetical protein n=1 Tax=Aquimarina sp. AD10 TaxID=1714849 RepID=UPI000E4AAE18|nr:hypothetical protein [Aquimarina sp. AD10]AXT63152.1 hypothetical protein D1816_23335 [Aquimarina sp. AD10]RKM98632.1 hypothetical protein D7033_11870 [Aquimarina sp. AD10]